MLAAEDGPPAASEAQLRRAVSTAYYAVFHTVLRAGAGQYMGDGGARGAGYGLIYRGFTHSRVKRVCEQLALSRLPGSLQRQLGRTAVSQDMQSFAEAFVALHDQRELADYDPLLVITQQDVVDAVVAADLALLAFDATAEDERADVLALMLVSGRA